MDLSRFPNVDLSIIGDIRLDALRLEHLAGNDLLGLEFPHDILIGRILFEQIADAEDSVLAND